MTSERFGESLANISDIQTLVGGHLDIPVQYRPYTITFQDAVQAVSLDTAYKSCSPAASVLLLDVSKEVIEGMTREK